MIRSDQKRRGMTLLELVIALALFGILSAFVMQVMNSVVNLWSSGERRGQGDLVFAAAVERFRGDLNALHTGSRGWLIVDQWEARSASEGVAAWYLPRIRFLADGAALTDVDPTNREPVEIMWTIVPEDPNSRFGRLVRFTNIENPQRSVRDRGTLQEMIRGDEGLTVMDGVLWTEFIAHDTDGQLTKNVRIDNDMPFDFPSKIDLTIEFVSGNARKQPANLDDPIAGEPEAVRLRGIAPIRLPEYALVGNEWVRIDGSFPNIRFSARGERDTLPGEYSQRTPVYMPSRYQSTNRIAADGRRLP
ncbi:MAG: type II secretion system protein [Planctomycetes bacterium]|nr:type II secretion system protein [Planctomycetota bacterium]MCP4861591.1 type II secretion system protein [Planctomycetota bacterium]